MTLPELGYYYHYKHDPSGPINNYAYEIVGTARHSEDETFVVLYRPLYEGDWFRPADYCARPLDMFMEDVEKDGYSGPRFIKITDPSVIPELERIKNEMYK